MNDLNEYAARLEQLLREGLDLASRVNDDDPITPALRDWHHEATTYVRRYQDEALARWENNRGEPTDEQVILQDAQDQLRNYNQ